jgi:hypothetical protein
MTRRTPRFLAAVTGLLAAATVLGSCSSNKVTGQDPQLVTVIRSTAPADGSSNFSVDSAAIAFFADPLTPQAARVFTMAMERNGRPVPGTVLVNRTRARYVPADRLSGQTLYRCSAMTKVRLEGGDLVRDFRVWTFTTGDSTPLPPPPGP